VYRLFDRYILKEVTPPFFIGLLIYTFVLLMNQILLLSELFITRGVSFRVVLELLVYLIPSVLAFTIPMSVLMGILAGLSRLSSDSEITAFKTLGISYKRLLWPILVFSFLGFLATSFFTLYLAPRANYKWVQILTQSVLTRIQFNIRPREFYESIPNTVIYIQDITPEMNWKNIFVYFSSNPAEPKVILAKEGKLNFFPEERRATLELLLGNVHSFAVDDPEEYRITSFSHYEEELNVEGIVPSIPEKKGVRQKDIKELWEDQKMLQQKLQEFPAEKTQSLSYRSMKREETSHWIEIHKKFALPFACFIFALLGLPLGTYTKKGGRTSGFTLSIGIILIYYILITAGEQMAMDGRISPFVGMWGSNIFFLAVGIYFFMQSVSESFFISFSFLLKKKAPGTHSAKKKRVFSRLPRYSFPFPNILDRYVIRKYLLIFSFVVVSMILVLAIVTFFDRINSVYEHNKPISDLLAFIWFKIPEFMQYILPVTALTASLLCLGLLAKSNEITAMKACGISIFRTIVPILVLAGLISFCSFYIQEHIQPYSNKKAEQIWNKINDIPARSYSSLDRRWVLSRGKDRIYHYQYFDPVAAAFSQISIFELDPENWVLKRRIYAEKGYLEGGSLGLSDAWVRDFAGSKTVRFEKKETLTLSGTEDSDYFQKERKEPDQMSYGELRDYIRDIEDRGFETIKFKVDLNFKITFPLTSFIMTLLGISFAFTMGKRGTLVGVGLSIAIAMIYWGAIGVFRSLGYVNYLSPFLAAWGPTLIFGSIGIYLISTLRT
jgi:LPS export ABC transporter permease LptF/LPS export ABC transporter permease LptG